MPTPYRDIYKKASVLFEDANLLGNLTDEEYEDLLSVFLSKAKSVYFKRCKKDLTDVDDELKQFNQTLSEEEIWLLSEGIKLVWLERKLYREENLRNKLSNKDYSIHSPANLLDKLTSLVDETRKNLKGYETDYTFNDFEGFY